MTRRIIKQTSFTTGELSPKLYGRVGTAEFDKGLETAENAYLTPYGPIIRRNGSKFIAEVKDSAAAVRLIRYQISQTLAFILEFGNQYIRFYKNSAQVLESDITITGITQADPGVVTAANHGLSDGDHIYITSVAGMTEVNKANTPYEVANKTTNTFELNDVDSANIDTSAFTAYSSGGTINKIHEVTSPYTTAQLDDIQYVQRGSTLYLVHPDVEPRTLIRTSDTNWTLDTLSLLPPPTYEAGYDYNLAIKPLATTGIDKEVIIGAVDLTGGTYQWTASGSGTNEYYCELNGGGDPSISTPLAVVENLVRISEGTMGSLSAGEYDYGDNDTLGYSTIYVRLTDEADPDSKASEFLVYSESDILLDGDEGRQIINETSSEAGRASITDVINGAVATTDIVEDFTDTNIITAGNSKLDLSPLVDLEFDATQAGSVVNIRSEYLDGSIGPKLTITAVTKANPGVVTSTAHGLSDGEKVQIKDIVGMTQINDKIFTVDGVTANTFELKGENTSGYTTYASGGTARKSLTDTSKNAFRSADVGKYILANGGVMQILTVNAADDIDAEILKSLNDSESTGNWSLETETWTASRGYPGSVGLYEERLAFGGTSEQPTTLWMSETGIFDGFGIGPDDEDAIDVDIVSSEVNEINWIASGRDLVIGTSGGEITINSGNNPTLTPSAIKQQPRTYHGSQTQQVALVKDEILFLQGSERKVRTFRYDFNIDGYTGEDLTFLSEHITEGGLKEIVYAQEPNTIIYAITNNGDIVSGVYDRPKQVIGWTKFITDGDYESVQSITKGEEDQIWVAVERKVNNATKRYIELFLNGDGTDDIHGYSDSYLTLTNALVITDITQANPGVVTSTAHGLSDGDTVIIKDLKDPESGDLTSTKTNMSSLNNCVFKVANKTANTFELNTLSDVNVNTTNYNAYGSGGNCWERVTTVSGLDHLEGKTVQIKIDGATHPNKTVSSGSITLDTASGEVVVGLPFNTTIKTLSIEYDTGIGSSQGQRSRWVKPILNVVSSGKPTLNGEFLPARNAADSMNKKVPLKTGFLEYNALDWNNTSALTITMSDPLPLQLIAITGTVSSGVK